MRSREFLPLLRGLALAAGLTAAWPAAAAPVRGAGLVWERSVVALAAGPGERTLTASFRFRNDGKRTVTLTSVETSCRCVDAQAEPASCRPGQDGRITVEFTPAGQTGRVEKTIHVESDAPGAAPIDLTLDIDLPAPHAAPAPHG